MCGVRVISREDGSRSVPSETARRASRRKDGMKIQSDPHGDMGTASEMSRRPCNRGSVRSGFAPGRKVTEVSEIPCRVSSDLHERRNDLGAVSTGGSANLKYR